MNGQGKRVTIFIGETDQWHYHPAYMAILEFLRREGCAGATVERGLAGFRANSRIKTASLLELSMDLPVVITWVDRPDRVERVLPHIAQMVPASLITIEDIHIYQYSSTLREGLPDVKVDQIMTRDVVTVPPEATLAEIVEELLDKPYTALPVVDSTGRLVGIISDTDLLERGDMEVSISLKRATDPQLGSSAHRSAATKLTHRITGNDGRAGNARPAGVTQRCGALDGETKPQAPSGRGRRQAVSRNAQSASIS